MGFFAKVLTKLRTQKFISSETRQINQFQAINLNINTEQTSFAYNVFIFEESRIQIVNETSKGYQCKADTNLHLVHI